MIQRKLIIGDEMLPWFLFVCSSAWSGYFVVALHIHNLLWGSRSLSFTGRFHYRQQSPDNGTSEAQSGYDLNIG